MGDNPRPTAPLCKAYSVTNIKAHVTLQLDLNQLNYDIWSEIFSNHCIGFDVADHIDTTYEPTKANPSNAPPTDPGVEVA